MFSYYASEKRIIILVVFLWWWMIIPVINSLCEFRLIKPCVIFRFSKENLLQFTKFWKSLGRSALVWEDLGRSGKAADLLGNNRVAFALPKEVLYTTTKLSELLNLCYVFAQDKLRPDNRFPRTAEKRKKLWNVTKRSGLQLHACSNSSVCLHPNSTSATAGCQRCSTSLFLCIGLAVCRLRV